MFLHKHPYPPYIPDNATKLIIGTLPPPRFTTGELKEGDVDFCYGSIDGQLWIILDRIFDLHLKFENTPLAIKQRKDFLNKRRIGICDIVASAKRMKMDASDTGMQRVKLRDLIKILQEHPTIDTLLFTGGKSKNGPEFFFRQHLKKYKLTLELVSDEVPRIHTFQLTKKGRTIKTITLTAPSGSANRAIGSLATYKRMKDENPDFTTIDFRVMQYKAFF
ncbi:MAG: uracil-DNA glycosylase family protein [Chitinophagaceae bacterium]|nr:MAG: uracil-DNA glycosylase family protein [Chitinophagaceae bacterium]